MLTYLNYVKEWVLFIKKNCIILPIIIGYSIPEYLYFILDFSLLQINVVISFNLIDVYLL